MTTSRVVAANRTADTPRRTQLDHFPDGPLWQPFRTSIYPFTIQAIEYEARCIDTVLKDNLAGWNTEHRPGYRFEQLSIEHFLSATFPTVEDDSAERQFRLNWDVCRALYPARIVVEEVGNSIETKIAAVEHARRVVSGVFAHYGKPRCFVNRHVRLILTPDVPCLSMLIILSFAREACEAGKKTSYCSVSALGPVPGPCSGRSSTRDPFDWTDDRIALCSVSSVLFRRQSSFRYFPFLDTRASPFPRIDLETRVIPDGICSVDFTSFFNGLLEHSVEGNYLENKV